MKSPEVIVVGAGIIGCTIAYELAQSGASVHVIETRAPGQGATRASAGILAPHIEGHGSESLRSLGSRSLDLYDDFMTRLRRDSGREVFYQRNGTFELAFSDADVERLGDLSATIRKEGIETRWIAPRDFAGLEPLASPNARGALLIAAHGFVGVTSMTLAAAAAAEKSGARITAATGAIRIHPLPGDRVGVQTSSSGLEADRVVLAAGSWSSAITVEGADPVPVRPIRGQLIQLQAEPGAIRRVMWGADGYLVPWPDGLVLVGSTVEDVGFDEAHTLEAVDKLRAAAVSLVPRLAAAEMTGIRTGLRPKGPDDLPILGRSVAVPGLIYATAHYRNGVLFTPLTVTNWCATWCSIAPPIRHCAISIRRGPADFEICAFSVSGGVTSNQMALLTPEEITAALQAAEGWTLDGKAIRKQFAFQDFPEAVLFVSALVPGAEDADHHPDIEIHYKRVILSYTTHDEGGLTTKDFDGASMADAVAANLPHLEEFGDG